MTTTSRTCLSGNPGLLPLLAGVSVAAVSTYTLLPAILPEIAAEFGVDPAVSGLVLAAATVPGIVLAPLFGALGDRYGLRATLVFCLVVFGVGGGLAAVAPTFPALVVLRLAQGVGTAGLIGLVIAAIGEHWSGPARATAMGRNAAALSCAIVALPPLGGLLAAAGGWRLAALPYAGGLLMAVVVGRRLPPTPPVAQSLREQLRATATALRQPELRGLLASGAVAFALLFGLVLTVLPGYLAAGLGLGPAGRGVLLAVPALASAAAALAVGRMTARYGARALLAAGFALMAAGFGVLAAMQSPPGIVVGLLVYGLGEGLVVPTLQAAVAGIGPAAARGTVVALSVSCTRVGQSAGPLLVAPLLATADVGAAFVLGAAVAALLAITWKIEKGTVR